MAKRLFRLQYASGLHLEMYNHVHFPSLVNPAAPYLALAGNVGNINSAHMQRFFKYANKRWEKVFYVLGTKEHNQHKMIKKDLKPYSNITLLDENNRSFYFPKDNLAIIGSSSIAQANVENYLKFWTYQKTNIVMLTHHAPWSNLQNITPQIKAWVHGYEDDEESLNTFVNDCGFPLEDTSNPEAVLEIVIDTDEDTGALDPDLISAATGIGFHSLR
jgi:hypothetical protein